MGIKKFGIMLIIGLLSLLPVRAYAATISDISNQLVCQCGCTMILANCTHEECMSRNAMTTLIAQKLDQGQSSEQIIQFFVAQYGEQVLASPPKKGFNLVAWILPFVAILAGAGVIYIFVRKLVKRGGSSLTPSFPVREGGDEKYQLQLEKELKEFTKGSFR